MNFKNCLLLSHVWMLEDQTYKKDIIDFCVRHFRENNSDLYIILTGHGSQPHESTVDLCDAVLWWLDLEKSEIGRGHPKLVDIGLAHAKEMGFKKILKQRADCIIADKNVHDLYDSLLNDKKLLVTNDHGVIGDLLMYGDIDVLLDGWKIEEWNGEVDGMVNFNNTLSRHDELEFTHIDIMKWVYLDPY